MEPEVPDEVQAAMSLKLVENVRALIRKELAAALVDPGVINPSSMFVVSQTVGQALPFNNDFVSNIALQLAARLEQQAGAYTPTNDYVTGSAVNETLRIAAQRLRWKPY